MSTLAEPHVANRPDQAPEQPGEPERDPVPAPLRRGLQSGGWGDYASHGLQYAITIGIFAFLGKLLDDWLGSEPWGILVMLMLGFVGATISLVKKNPVSGASRDKDPDPPR